MAIALTPRCRSQKRPPRRSRHRTGPPAADWRRTRRRRRASVQPQRVPGPREYGRFRFAGCIDYGDVIGEAVTHIEACFIGAEHRRHRCMPVLDRAGTWPLVASSDEYIARGRRGSRRASCRLATGKSACRFRQRNTARNRSVFGGHDGDAACRIFRNIYLTRASSTTTMADGER